MAAHAALKTSAEVNQEKAAHQRFHYDSKTGHVTGFDGRVLDVEAGSRAEGAAVLYFDKGPHLSPNQQWDYDAKAGTFASRMGTGFVIDLKGGVQNVKNGGELIVWRSTGNDNQKWDVDENGFIRMRVNPAFVIDVNGGPKPAQGVTKVSLWTCLLSAADAALLPKLRVSAHQRWAYDAKTGYITGFDGRVLDVEGGNAAQGTKLIVFDRNAGANNAGTANQLWDYKDGSFYSRMGTGFVIDVSGGKFADGTDLILWSHHGGPNQKWDVDANGFIRSRAQSKFCIDINGGAKAAKGLSKVTLWTALI